MKGGKWGKNKLVLKKREFLNWGGEGSRWGREGGGDDHSMGVDTGQIATEVGAPTYLESQGVERGN